MHVQPHRRALTPQLLQFDHGRLHNRVCLRRPLRFGAVIFELYVKLEIGALTSELYVKLEKI